MDNSKNDDTPNTDIDEDIDEFDGVKPNSVRCGAVQNPPTTEFGFPTNITDISPRASDEFEANAEEVTRHIAALDFAPSTQSSAFDSASSEFDVGATFSASQSLFATPNIESLNIESLIGAVDTPPIFPFYLKPVPTSFRSNKSFTVLKPELENAFSECSVVYTQVACGYSCSAVQMLSYIEIDVKCFMDGDELLVEFRRLDGCRHAFSEISGRIANKLNVSFACHHDAPKKENNFCPPACSLDDSLLEDLSLEMPSLSRSFGHESDLLHEDASKPSVLQGVRATGCLALEEIDCSMSTECFSQGGDALPLAQTVTKLARTSDDDEVRSVAMAAVAQIATLEHVCGQWLEETIPTLVAGASDDFPHFRRESLRALHAISTRDKKLAAKLVRSGVVPSLELEANGGEEDQSPDMAMQSLAQGALQACR
eukprot:CAMPEP_0114392126 /NCGR_PEP_ID=MMETSP0102-20121206/10574_1 /TAXON_ID=38822 ORGANISM="Pteridomonas danica, Strain PT" /NCGR_SAMPLE_ID=MMETSP0102 /ASSEMBLY_ACC=CAM_ASM_000212 /LENGTH=426 /DNA_ID=CAMNT_0001551169 /DNA_START=197 /DNA_END=1473 /DNA_ORIENTATION=+